MFQANESLNPYTLQFSFSPPQMIKRTIITEEIINNFTRPIPTYRGMFISGVRGSGKTVLLGNIRKEIAAMKGWVTVDLNPEDNLLEGLARSLYMIPELKALFVKARLDFSVVGIGLHLEKADLVAANEEDAVTMMLKILKKAGKKLLVTIDEVTYSKDVARFSHALSSYAGADYDIYLLMTSLKENINNIRNKKSLTFLYRAKVKELDNLNITAITKDYMKTLQVKREAAEELAYKTEGYSLAFQTIGYFYWQALCSGKDYSELKHDAISEEIDIILAELAYDKIWDELSVNDQKVLKSLAKFESEQDSNVKVELIRDDIQMTSENFSVYRKRLVEDGIIESKQYGFVRYRLPGFGRYVRNKNL